MKTSSISGKKEKTWGTTWEIKNVGSEDSFVMLSFKLAEQHKSF